MDDDWDDDGPDPAENIPAYQDLLTTCFSRDLRPRFQLQSHLKSGADSAAWKIRYTLGPGESLPPRDMSTASDLFGGRSIRQPAAAPPQTALPPLMRTIGQTASDAPAGPPPASPDDEPVPSPVNRGSGSGTGGSPRTPRSRVSRIRNFFDFRSGNRSGGSGGQPSRKRQDRRTTPSAIRRGIAAIVRTPSVTSAPPGTPGSPARAPSLFSLRSPGPQLTGKNPVRTLFGSRPPSRSAAPVSVQYRHIVLKHDKRNLRWDPGNPHQNPLLVEYDDDDVPDDDVDEQGTPIQREIRCLNMLDGCSHIVQQFQFAHADPLSAQYPGIAPNFLAEWLYTEYIEHGTVYDFREKMVRKNLIPIPNRVLWVWLKCLADMAIQMAWGDDSSDIVPTKRITHSDLHEGNVMITNESTAGDGLHGDENVPKLKCIDFGAAVVDQEEDDPLRGVKENMFQVGKIMAILAMGNDDVLGALFPESPGTPVNVRISGNLPLLIQTTAGALTRPSTPGLDSDLRQIIYQCMTVVDQENARFDPRTLRNVAIHAISTRDEAWYTRERAKPVASRLFDGNPRRESHIFITTTLQEGIHNP
ncbi:hypothetical protein F4778DRAFT_737354 [Xylariomycetidae sp. FL2044]|nr:hypothetical protein F4778DRAFT_737354 [Xylariomycetidae sp. FL2044]